MPKSLYDRLCGAQNPSSYRQQFLALLVCRPAGQHSAPAYLRSAKIRAYLIMTIIWDFPGNGRPPIIRIAGNPPSDVNCISLRAFLEANGLLDAFEKPTEDARALKLLDETDYEKNREDVDKWQSDPTGAVKFP
jgi:hypothetical protein